MTVVLVHHAQAVPPDVDPQRPLSDAGVEHARRLAERARQSGIAPAAIWHSGKLRARQTAEAFLLACNPSAEFRMVKGLGPDDEPRWMTDVVAAETRDLLLVSHMPLIPALARALAPAIASFPAHGLVALARSGEIYEERLRLESTDE